VDEFDLIKEYFSPLENGTHEVVVGNGDDAAIINMPAGKSIALSVDTLVEGVHFLSDAPARMVGYRAAAINFSDMAAMGATPCYALLSLTIPSNCDKWLRDFSLGLGECFREYDCSLIGGDTTRGPLTISLTIIGAVSGRQLTRARAQIGDCILVSGTLGDARAALDILNKPSIGVEEKFLVNRYERPIARTRLSVSLLGVANSAIDVSDGLLADLGHVATASKVGINVYVDTLPISTSLESIYGEDKAREFALSGGDDYEVIYAIPETFLDEAHLMANKTGTRLTQIGIVTAGSEVRCFTKGGKEIFSSSKGFSHF
jgi:thiamine-monophosphate kinase